MEKKSDKELEAIRHIIGSLSSLDPDARKRVLHYILRRLDIDIQDSELLTEQQIPLHEKQDKGFIAGVLPKSMTDIRSLKEEKDPKTAIEMAVLVAYYLSELAPKNERKENINSNDIKKYFKQAGFPLPMVDPVYTLRNAKNAGYLDFTGNAGVYEINPVGYNLVAYNLPKEGKVLRIKKKKSRISKTKKIKKNKNK